MTARWASEAELWAALGPTARELNPHLAHPATPTRQPGSSRPAARPGPVWPYCGHADCGPDTGCTHPGTWTLTVPGPPGALATVNKTNASPAAKRFAGKAPTRRLAAELARRAGVPRLARFRIGIRYWCTDWRACVDPDSLDLWLKAMVDGLREAGVVPDDNPRVWLGKTVEPAGLDRGNPRVEVTIESVAA